MYERIFIAWRNDVSGHYTNTNMRGICRLTYKDSDLQHSHIYPKFVIDWYRKTGGKYLRGAKNPNLRSQDGYKKYLLSFEAEQLFSLREKWFAENVFHNYMENPFNPIDYDENLFYFSISFLWRFLVLELEQPNIKDFKSYETLIEAEEQWRQFLYKGIYPKNYDRVHLMLTDRIKDHDLEVKGVDYYFSRIMDGTIIFNEKTNFLGVYAKFARYIFWAFFINGDESKLEGTRINPIKGVLKIPQIVNEPAITGFFVNRIEEISKLDYPSENQQNKIVEEFRNNPNFNNNSDATQSILRDIEFDKKNNAR